MDTSAALRLLIDHYTARVAMLDRCIAEKALVTGEDTEAAIHHLFAVTDYFMEAEKDTMNLLHEFIRLLAPDLGDVPPSLSVVRDEPER